MENMPVLILVSDTQMKGEAMEIKEMNIQRMLFIMSEFVQSTNFSGISCYADAGQLADWFWKLLIKFSPNVSAVIMG